MVFVPGLAERMFPQKPREDPLLLDALRAAADAVACATQPHRLAAERLLLQLAAGAASDRLYVSYPRIELTESRARVPSFYALDVMRAATGRVPDYEWLEARAREAGNATLAWPAPSQPDEAIDDLEHDLAVAAAAARRAGSRAASRATPITCSSSTSVFAGRSSNRWARGEPRWSVSDGLIRVSTRHARDARRPATHCAALFAFGASAFQRVPVPVPAGRLLPPCSRSSSRSRCSAWIR